MKEVKPVKVDRVEEWKVDKILNKRKIRGVIEYLVWCKKFTIKHNVIVYLNSNILFWFYFCFLYFLWFDFQFCFVLFCFSFSWTMKRLMILVTWHDVIDLKFRRKSWKDNVKVHINNMFILWCTHCVLMDNA